MTPAPGELAGPLLDLERRLDPADPAGSRSGAEVLGYGEVSAVLAHPALPGWALKRMSGFPSREAALAYTGVVARYLRTREPHDRLELLVRNINCSLHDSNYSESGILQLTHRNLDCPASRAPISRDPRQKHAFEARFAANVMEILRHADEVSLAGEPRMLPGRYNSG